MKKTTLALVSGSIVLFLIAAVAVLLPGGPFAVAHNPEPLTIAYSPF